MISLFLEEAATSENKQVDPIDASPNAKKSTNKVPRSASRVVAIYE